MKEAAGEANITVITVVLIGVIAAVGMVLIPRLTTSMKAKSCCTDGGGYVSGNTCCYDNEHGKCGSHYVLNGSAFKSDERYSACMAD